MSAVRPPLPPFDEAAARARVRAAENAWNGRDPVTVAGGYTEHSVWRNRSEFLTGHDQIIAFLTAKWAREHEYRLVKNLHAFRGNRIAVRFRYEWHDASGQWWRSFGNENWAFAEDGRMHRREASINDVAITEAERRYTWPAPGPRPDDWPEMDDRPD